MGDLTNYLGGNKDLRDISPRNCVNEYPKEYNTVSQKELNSILNKRINIGGCSVSNALTMLKTIQECIGNKNRRIR